MDFLVDFIDSSTFRILVIFVVHFPPWLFRFISHFAVFDLTLHHSLSRSPGLPGRPGPEAAMARNSLAVTLTGCEMIIREQLRSVPTPAGYAQRPWPPRRLPGPADSGGARPGGGGGRASETRTRTRTARSVLMLSDRLARQGNRTLKLSAGPGTVTVETRLGT